MTVQELMTRLSREDPDAVVLVAGPDTDYADVDDLAVVEQVSRRPPPLPTRESGEFPAYVPTEATP